MIPLTCAIYIVNNNEPKQCIGIIQKHVQAMIKVA